MVGYKPRLLTVPAHKESPIHIVTGPVSNCRLTRSTLIEANAL